MREIRLNERLAAAASFIEEGSRVADIGTDHGYLPIWLVCNSICKNPIATDLRDGPLSRAKSFAIEYGVSSSISFRLGDGLEPISPGEVDTLVIAGMGGETINGILAAAPWVKHEDCKIILQPQSKVPELSSWLEATGFYLSNAKLSEDSGRIYLTLEVSRGDMPTITPAQYYVPDNLMENNDPLLGDYTDRIIIKLKNAMDGIKKSNVAVDSKKTEFISEALEGLYRLRGELRK